MFSKQFNGKYQFRIFTVLALILLAITDLAFGIAVKEQSNSDDNSNIGNKPIKLASSKYGLPGKTCPNV